MIAAAPAHSYTPLWPQVEPKIVAAQKRPELPRPNADGWIAPLRSPLRADDNPSFSVLPDTPSSPGAWKDHGTNEGGSIADLAGRLGIDPRISSARHLPPPDKDDPPMTLARFAEKRGLDERWLAKVPRLEETVHRGRPAVRYPTGRGIKRVKYLDGQKPKYTWETGGGAAHWYGLRGASPIGGPLYIVNGEPSVWACQQNNVAAVCLCAGEGVVPDTALISELAETWATINVVYDRDAAGTTGGAKVAEALRSGGLGNVLLRRLPDYLPDGGDVGDLCCWHGGAALAGVLENLPAESGTGEDVPDGSVAATVAAERGVLALAMGTPDTIEQMLPLEQGHFADPRHGVIWQAIMAVRHGGKKVHPISVLEHIADVRPPSAERTALEDYLGSLRDTIMPDQAPEYGQRVRDYALTRRIGALLPALCERAAAGDRRTIELAQQLGQVAAGAQGLGRGRSLRDALDRTLDYLDLLWTDKVPPGIPTGIATLDSMGMFNATDLVVIGARTGVGKSAFAVQIARLAALNTPKGATQAEKKGHAVLYISLEMDYRQLSVRQLAAHSLVPMAHMTRAGSKSVTGSEIAAVMQASEAMATGRMRIVDEGDLHIDAICAHARAQKADPSAGLDLVIVDYLQAIPTPLSDRGRSSTYDEVASHSRRLKALARELGVCVVALSQINRRGGQGIEEGRRPTLGDLAKSGQIEQDANSIIIVSQDIEGVGTLDAWEAQDQRRVFIDVVKNRQGPVRLVHGLFHAEHQRFEDISTSPL